MDQSPEAVAERAKVREAAIKKAARNRSRKKGSNPAIGLRYKKRQQEKARKRTEKELPPIQRRGRKWSSGAQQELERNKRRLEEQGWNGVPSAATLRKKAR